MTLPLHILEPTLTTQTGHCYGYVRSLLKTQQAAQFQLHVWLGRQGKNLFQQEKCQIHPYFVQKLRKIQTYFCLRALLRSADSLFIPTAGRLDLIYLHRLLKKNFNHSIVFLHFHQWRDTPEKMALLKKIAKAHPSFVMMAPTEKLLAVFKQAGFSRCEYVPCPGYETHFNTSQQIPIGQKLIYAGAARADKGFPQVIPLIKYLSDNHISLPVELQLSPPSSGRYDSSTEKAIAMLQQYRASHVTVHPHTLDQKAYQQLFQHAVALLLYDSRCYHNKFSGVALDAFSAGCPVITTENTWASDIVRRFGAGIVINDCEPHTVYQAAQSIQQNYLHYHNNAIQAGKVLQQEHDPANTLAVFLKYINRKHE